MKFVYSVVRFVPDPGRGEFINVGAIVGSEESSEWEARQIENPVRARAIDERGTLDSAWSFLDRVGRQIDDYEKSLSTLLEPSVEPSEAWLRELAERHRNLVQLTPPAPMVAESIEEATDRVFSQLVLDPARQRYRFQKKHAALAAVRKAYREKAIPQFGKVFERIALETDHHRERVDFAVANGFIVQMTQTWSFQVPEQESLAEQVKAWGWTIRDVKEAGGHIRVENETIKVLPDVDVRIVYVSPIRDQPAPALEDALAVAEVLEIEAVPMEMAEGVAFAALEKLRIQG